MADVKYQAGGHWNRGWRNPLELLQTVTDLKQSWNQLTSGEFPKKPPSTHQQSEGSCPQLAALINTDPPYKSAVLVLMAVG